MFSMQDVFNLMIGVGSIAGPIVYKIIASRIKDAEEAGVKLAQEAKDIALDFGRRHNQQALEIERYKALVADKYVSIEALERIVKPIMDELKKIDDKLDRKMDKA